MQLPLLLHPRKIDQMLSNGLVDNTRSLLHSSLVEPYLQHWEQGQRLTQGVGNQAARSLPACKCLQTECQAIFEAFGRTKIHAT